MLKPMLQFEDRNMYMELHLIFQGVFKSNELYTGWHNFFNMQYFQQIFVLHLIFFSHYR